MSQKLTICETLSLKEGKMYNISHNLNMMYLKFCLFKFQMMEFHFKECNLYVFSSVPPEFEIKSAQSSVRRGSSQTLQCQAIGDGPMSIEWQREGIRFPSPLQPR
jgi:hypothetical protein